MQIYGKNGGIPGCFPRGMPKRIVNGNSGRISEKKKPERIAERMPGKISSEISLRKNPENMKEIQEYPYEKKSSENFGS